MKNKIAKKILKMEKDKLMSKPESDRDWALITALDVAIYALEVKPQGEWNCTFHSTFPQYEPSEYRCSICNGRGGKLDKFCKHCGAQMKAGAE